MIPLVDLAAQHASIRAEIDAALAKVLESSQFILGPAVAQFEREFAAYCSVRHAIGVNSGTSALHLALLALGIGPGDEVITVPHTFLATVAAIRYTGAQPVFVDVDEDRFTLDPHKLPAAITARTRAIVAVHLYGQAADMAPILRIADAAQIPVIEDAAQAHGATYKGKVVGSIGRIGCFSFYPSKNLGACGEAGAIVTADDELAQRMRAMRDWGQLEHQVHELPGFNYRMEAMQGAILGVKLRHLPEWNAMRQLAARRYDELLQASGIADKVRPPARFADAEHVYHQYVIRVAAERDRLRDELARREVQTAIHYPRPVHLQPVVASLGYRKGDFPCSERIAGEALSLPMHPALGEETIRRVVRAVEDSVAALAR